MKKQNPYGTKSSIVLNMKQDTISLFGIFF